MKVEWHDIESVNTQETILRRDASDVEEAVLDEERTAIKRIFGDSDFMQNSDTEDVSQSETVGFAAAKMHWSKWTGQRPDEGHGQRVFRIFLKKSGPILT